MSPPASRFRCAGCGASVDEAGSPPFRCAQAKAGDDVDHVLVREDALKDVAFPPPAVETNPFLRYAELLHARRFARDHQLTDADWSSLVRRLDAAVAEVDGREDGRGFVETPFTPSESLRDALGFVGDGVVWAKDETSNVAGSHKARHLFGVMLYLEVRRRVGFPVPDPGALPSLAIASCGNAALAAAVVAKAAGYPLDVFVPPDADAAVLRRLADLDARITSCPRGAGVGDPCLQRFRDAVTGGALPFTCQGSENGLTIDGGRTLGWEMATAWTTGCAATGASPASLDRVFVQVGGGALAAGVIAGLQDAVVLGALARMPRIHTVQTAGGHPLERAHRLVEARISDTGESAETALRHAAGHRSAFMWPWETPPVSAADGILDDETYDWLAVVKGMLETGGGPIVVDEETIGRANELAQPATSRPVSMTGSAGLAGLLSMRESGAVGPGERVAVLFTGARR